MKNDLPDGWGLVNMSDVCKVINGSTPKTSNSNYWDGEILWITPKDLSKFNGIFINDTERKITKKGYDSCPTTLIPRGAVIMSSRAPIGYLAIAGKEMCTNQGFKSFVCSEKINNLYLYFFLKSIVPALKSGGSGTTFDELSKSKAENIKIPIPFPDDLKKSLETQKKIVDKLDAFFKEYEILKREKEIAKENYTEIMKCALDSLITNNISECNKYSLGELAEYINGRAFKKSEWVEKGIPIIRIQNLKDVNNSYNYFNGAYDKKHEINDGDILFSWSGTVGTSFGAFEWKRDKALLNQHIFKIIPNKKIIVPEFFMHLLNSMINEINSEAHGGVGLGHITKERFTKMSVSLPSISTQKIITQKLVQIEMIFEDMKKEERIADNNLKYLSQSILTKAFKGKLVN